MYICAVISVYFKLWQLAYKILIGQTFPSTNLDVHCLFSVDFSIFHSILTCCLSARLLSFWMSREHATTCSHCFWYYPYSFICASGIILFIEAWNWTALADHISDPVAEMCWQGPANLVTNVTTPAPRIIAFKQADVQLHSPSLYHTHTHNHYLYLPS